MYEVESWGSKVEGRGAEECWTDAAQVERCAVRKERRRGEVNETRGMEERK